MAHKACHVGYKHAGLHYTDYRIALYMSNKFGLESGQQISLCFKSLF